MTTGGQRARLAPHESASREGLMRYSWVTHAELIGSKAAEELEVVLSVVHHRRRCALRQTGVGVGVGSGGSGGR